MLCIKMLLIIFFYWNKFYVGIAISGCGCQFIVACGKLLCNVVEQCVPMHGCSIGSTSHG